MKVIVVLKRILKSVLGKKKRKPGLAHIVLTEKL